MENKKYHVLVWETAKKNTEFYFKSDKWAWIGSVITGIATGIYTTILFHVWSGGEMYPLTVSIVGIVFGTVFGLAFFIVILWGWNGFWIVPTKLYREEKRKADRSNWNDVIFSYKEIREGNEIMAYRIKSRKQKV